MAKKITQKYPDYNRIQILMQLHDKGLISTRTLLGEFELDYDKEVEQIREQCLPEPCCKIKTTKSKK